MLIAEAQRLAIVAIVTALQSMTAQQRAEAIALLRAALNQVEAS